MASFISDDSKKEMSLIPINAGQTGVNKFTMFYNSTTNTIDLRTEYQQGQTLNPLGFPILTEKEKGDLRKMYDIMVSKYVRK